MTAAPKEPLEERLDAQRRSWRSAVSANAVGGAIAALIAAAVIAVVSLVVQGETGESEDAIDEASDTASRPPPTTSTPTTTTVGSFRPVEFTWDLRMRTPSSEVDADETALCATQTRGDGDTAQWVQLNAIVDVSEGTQLRFSGRYWTEQTHQLHMKVFWLDSAGEILLDSIHTPIDAFDGALGERTFSISETVLGSAPANASQAQLQVLHGVEANTTNITGSYVCVADIEIEAT
ncbi:MAG: hypothetical protein AAGA37_07910 [Actinomycetota bacterium]